ncbi:MAG: lipoprotein [Gammaproteobacteria bacterium]|nr:lipoprotein [Gammaproteobacteria bacterium]
MHGIEQKRRATGRWAMIGMLCLLLLAACGQKGDLYLPTHERADSRQSG